MGRSVVQYGGLVTVLSINKDFYFPGEPVQMFLNMVNVSPQPVRLTFPTAQRYDFVAAGTFGEVWRWSTGRFFAQRDSQVPLFMPQVVETITLRPGENLFYREIWNQEDNSGRRVPPGVYVVSGWNTFNGSEYLPRPYVYITVGGPWYSSPF